MKNIAVIGCGKVAGYGHLPAIAESGRWNLSAVVDSDAGRLEEVRTKFNAEHAFNEVDALWGLSDLDAVVIATHAESHHALTLAALKRGLHVLCEKPMASTTGQCREMVEAARQADRLLAVNFNTRSGLPYRRIKGLIDDGAIGAVRVVRFVYDWSCHQWQPPERLEHFMANGGPIVDSGVHFFDGVRWLSGQEIGHINATGVRLPPHEHPQHVIATCQLGQGAIGLVEVGWLYTRRTKDQGQIFQITAIGDDGTLDYDYSRGTLKVFTRDRTDEIELADMSKHFDRVLDLFAGSIEQGRLIELASGEDGLRATDAAYRALAATAAQ